MEKWRGIEIAQRYRCETGDKKERTTRNTFWNSSVRSTSRLWRGSEGFPFRVILFLWSMIQATNVVQQAERDGHYNCHSLDPAEVCTPFFNSPFPPGPNGLYLLSISSDMGFYGTPRLLSEEMTDKGCAEWWVNLYSTCIVRYILRTYVGRSSGLSWPCIILIPSSKLAPREQPQRDRDVGIGWCVWEFGGRVSKQSRQAASSVVVAVGTRLARGRLRYLQIELAPITTKQVPRVRMARVPVHKMMNDSRPKKIGAGSSPRIERPN